jgi:hypothetical protein
LLNILAINTLEVAVYTFLAYLIFSTVLEEIKQNFNIPMKESKIKSLKLFRTKQNYKKKQKNKGSED